MSNNKQQTAVEWLWEQIDEILPFSVDTETGIKLYNAKEQAKEMEKKQHGKTWDNAIQANEQRGYVKSRSICDFDEYFNETYGGNK